MRSTEVEQRERESCLLVLDSVTSTRRVACLYWHVSKYGVTVSHAFVGELDRWRLSLLSNKLASVLATVHCSLFLVPYLEQLPP